jgi:formate hydrogenlyase subunit 4
MNILSIILAILLAPLFVGIVNQTKAFFASRRGPGLFRLYVDIAKLLRKSCPRPVHSTWLFDIAQASSLGAVVTAAIIFPWTGASLFASIVPAAFFFYILAAGRFFTVIGALDSGNAFEGMGASREVQFSVFAEPIIFVILGFLVLLTKDISLSHALLGITSEVWKANVISLILVFLAFFGVFLLENCRVPFDDPETHLELTMIHEAMLLDVGGSDLAFALYAAALKFELLGAFLVMMFMPTLECGLSHTLIIFSAVALLSVAVGIIESIMARFRLLKTPEALIGLFLVASLAVLIHLSF